MSVNHILTIDQLYDISTFMAEKGYDNGNVTIEIGVPDHKTLNRINADFFYRNNQYESGSSKPDDVEEVGVNIGNVHFLYKVNADSSK